MRNKIIKALLAVLLAGMLCGACAMGPTEEPDGAEKAFTVVVVFEDGSELSYQLKSTKEMLGDALLAEKLIAGEKGPYGLYVLDVAGEHHKWEEDGKYWALYINGEVALSGVDSTRIEDGATYMLKVE